MTNRIYYVTANGVSRLVEAPNKSAAVRHCASEFKAHLASQQELVMLLEDGVKVEQIGMTVKESRND